MFRLCGSHAKEKIIDHVRESNFRRDRDSSFLGSDLSEGNLKEIEPVCLLSCAYLADRMVGSLLSSDRTQ